ncbi:MAG: gfo/Idh/MocA family oxidoreductase [Armatimonadia bacterium]|nr:gfo/Idh/MocA family oxidoreductase [Armatimonadia bacterium]
MAPIGVGVLSFAHGHVNAYCSQMKSWNDEVKLIAAWDANETRGARQAEAFGMDYRADVADVLSDPEIEAVFIASETSEHARLVEAAAAAGKTIVLQKPLAFRIEDCDRIEAAVESAGVRFTVAYQMRHDPANQKMRELVLGGEIGRVGLLRRRHCIPVLFNEGFYSNPETQWHVQADKNFGMFMDDACHAADFIYWIMGMPTSVMAEIDNVLTDIAPDDTGVALYRHDSGAMSILTNASVTHAGVNTTEIYGDEGVIIQDYGDGPSNGAVKPPEDAVGVKIFKASESGKGFQPLDVPVPEGHGERIHGVARPMVDWLKDDNAPPPCPLREARCSVEMCLGAYASAESGSRVAFPLAG